MAVGRRMASGDARLALANAQHYMHLLGHTVIAWQWLRQATVAQRALAAANPPDTDFYRGKLQACRFFFATELPQVELAAKLVAGAEPSAFAMQDAWF